MNNPSTVDALWHEDWSHTQALEHPACEPAEIPIVIDDLLMHNGHILPTVPQQQIVSMSLIPGLVGLEVLRERTVAARILREGIGQHLGDEGG